MNKTLFALKDADESEEEPEEMGDFMEVWKQWYTI